MGGFSMIRSFLVRHLGEIENEREVVLREYYPQVSVESIEFERLIGSYIRGIEDYIKNTQFTGDKPGQIPFVLIGSIVDIQDTYDQSVETIRIVSPFLSQGQVNYTFASYLSPMGRELLLKGKGDEVEVKFPGGCSHYRINDIRLSR
jgi:transcription elongation GreA/GreB family factor